MVFDEADLLFAGGYAHHLNIITDALKAWDRESTAKRACAELGISLDGYWEMPRFMRKAIQMGGREGAAAALDAGYQPPPLEQEVSDESNSNNNDNSNSKLPWVRQYIYVAATMPREGGKNVGADIAAAHYNDIEWLSGLQLHQSRRLVSHSWVPYSSMEERIDALVSALRNTSPQKTMVFCKDVASANATVAALQQSPHLVDSCSIYVYHRSVPKEERERALGHMGSTTANSSKGVVLVCTDAAARGLDIQGVDHVIQADFAKSAIDFLHRAGRTARAGKAGRVTSLYDVDAEPLVNAIREAVEAGKPVEGAFSRKRSFRKKFKRYGMFVPRGECSSA